MRWTRAVSGLLTTVLAGAAIIALPATAAVADPTSADEGDPTVTADALPTAQIDGVVWSQVIVGNTVYVGGEFTAARPAGSPAGQNTVARTNLLAYDLTTGNLINAWAPTANGPVYALAASPDGSRIYVGGNFNRINGKGRSRIAALDPSTGGLINSLFQSGTNGEVRALAVATDGTLYLGGTFNTVAGATRNRVASFTSAGVLRSFYANVQSYAVRAVAVSPDGTRVFVGGAFEKVNEIPRLGTAALSGANGALLSWDISDQMYTHGAQAGTTALVTDDVNVYGAAFAYYASAGALGNNEGAYAVNQITGRVTWLTDCHGDTYSVYANPGQDHVYVAGHPHMCNNGGAYPEVSPRHHQYATSVSKAVWSLVTPNTQTDAYYVNNEGFGAPEMRVFFPEFTEGTYTGQSQATWHVTGNDQYVVYGGEFLTVNGVAQQGMVRFAKSPISPGEMGPTQTASTLKPTVQSHARGTMQVSWPTFSDYDDKWLTYTVLRNGVEVGSVTAASKFWNRPRLSFTDSGLRDSTSYSYTIRVTDSTGNSKTSPSTSASTVGFFAAALSPYAQTVLDDHPNTYYRLGETNGNFQDWTSWSDASLGTSGITRNVPGAVAGDSNGAARFNGSTNARVYSNSQEYGQDNLSIEAWFTTTTPGGKIVGFGSTRGVANSGNYDRHIYMGADGRLTFGVYPGGVRAITSPAGYADGAWHQVVATLGKSGMKLYVDGQVVAQNTDVVAGQASFNGYWRIGGDQVSGWPNSNGVAFVGDIDEVSTYGRQLSDFDVARHYGIATTGTVPNAAPVASFTVTGGELTASVDASASTDSDGTIAAYEWAWGDGQTSTTTIPTATHTYADGGRYTVVLTVRDDDDATGSASNDVDVTAPNKAPTASFTAAATNLAVAFDGSVSSDPDGTVSSYQWTFGDGATAATTTPTTSHTYLVPGTYPVSLTVVDDDGLASAASQVPVTVTAPPGVGDTLAADGFGRTVASGWGSADLGGAWSVTAGAGSVGNGFGTLVVANPGGVVGARLPGVTGTDFNVRATVTWDKRPDGSGGNTLLRGRITASGEYRLKTQFKANGQMSAWVVRATSAGNETRIGSVVSVPGTYSAGTAVRQRLELTGTSPTTLKAKVWIGDEPAAWLIEITDSTAGLQVDGHTGLAAMTSSTTTNSPVSAAFDDFTVTVGGVAPPANQPPTAAVQASADNLLVTASATGSGDPDGSIVSYLWAWGDGTTTTTDVATATHTYAVASPTTFPVDLTVTDDAGATATAATTVSVTPPGPPAPLAVDTFERTVASGWGNADTGGTWSTTAGAASVAAGVGRLTASSAGQTVGARLPGWSGTSAMTTVAFTLSDRPVGAGAYTLIRGRITTGGEYRLKTQLKATGVIVGWIVRSNASGAETRISDIVTVPGSYAAGTVMRQKMVVTGTSPTAIRAKVWVDGTEPDAWLWDVTDSTAALQIDGHTGLALSLTPDATNVPLSASFDDFTVVAP